MPKAKGLVVGPGQPPREAEDTIQEAEDKTPQPQPTIITPEEIAQQINEIQARLDLLEKYLQDIQAKLAKKQA